MRNTKDNKEKDNKKIDTVVKEEYAKSTKWVFPLVFGLAGILLVGILGFAGYKMYLSSRNNAAERLAKDATQKQYAYELAGYTFHRHAVEEISKGSGENIAKFVTEAGRITADGVKNRPPYVTLTPENTANFATVDSVLYNAETALVDVNILVPQNVLPISDDGYYYLFSKKIYEDGDISGEPITRIEKDVDFTISCDLNYNKPDSRLFSRFCLAVLLDGKYVQVSNEMYITNPEAHAGYSSSRDGVGNKKGLLVNPDMIGALSDLGVKHAAYNIYTSLIMNGGGISYTYNGHTYNYNAYQVGLYDLVFSRMTSAGIDANAIIINDLNNSQITYPGSRGGSATLYAFNPTDEEGVNALAALASFLVNRYSGASGHGKVSNWIIGNEVNERVIYNYTPNMGLKEYAELYADTVRIFYNTMSAFNSSSRVYVSFDNRWNLDKGDSSYFDVKDMLDAYNSYICSEGNFNWDVGYHSYNYPLNAPKAWDVGKYESLVTNSPSSPVISMKNIHVLTDYLGQQHYLNNDGQVRRVVLSEMGYTSTKGADYQAASIAYAYKIMEKNSHIDYMLLSRQVDAASEVAGDMALGITGKPAYNVYKACGSANEDAVLNTYMNMIGISSWSQIQNPR